MHEKPHVLLCVCGCVQAEVTPRLVHNLLNHPELRKQEVIVAATPNALNFFEKSDVEKISGRPLFIQHSDSTIEFEVPHISLAEWADLVLVYPSSANSIAKCAAGICDTLVTNIILAAKCPVYFGPTMNDAMYEASATQRNLKTLKKLGYHIIERQMANVFIHATQETVQKLYVTEAAVLNVCMELFPK